MATCGSRLLRTCRGEAFAKAYEESALKRSNDEDLEAALQQHSSLNKDTLKELSVTQATVTPFWWALFVMFKVRCGLSRISWSVHVYGGMPMQLGRSQTLRTSDYCSRAGRHACDMHMHPRQNALQTLRRSKGAVGQGPSCTAKLTCMT